MNISQLTFKQFYSIIVEDNQALLTQLNAQLATLDQRINSTVTPLQKQRAALAQRIATLQKQMSANAPQQQQQQQQQPTANPVNNAVPMTAQ